jgi:lysophospholipase L1-like esterase
MQRTSSVSRILPAAMLFAFACSNTTNSSGPQGGSSSGGATTLGGTPSSGGKPVGTGGSGSGGSTVNATGGASGGAQSSGGKLVGTGGSASGGLTGTATGGALGGSGGVGAGGSAAGGSSAGLTLGQACTAMCASQAQMTNACPVADCQNACVKAADATVSAITKCNVQYTAMAQCEAALGSDKWTCSSDENVPIPVDGQCTTTVCTWACCATDLIVPTDIWARCMDTCNQSGTGGASGTGGTSAAGGNTGTGGKGGSGGTTARTGGTTGGGGTTNTGGTAIGGAGGAPPASTGVPAGYPAPTADNAAKCTTVAMSGGFCPGGGSGPTCLQCLFGSTTYNTSETPPAPADATSLAGDYVVTAQLGSVGPVFVSAESSRGLLSQGAASQTYAFVVDVRPMEGQPNHAGGPVGYAGLDMFFSGPAGLKVTGIGYALAGASTKPVMVYIAGDSTVCDQTGNAFGGWGQMIPQYFGPPVGFANYANSGAASGSFGSYWSMIKAKWTAGDWVMIQFGHNDKTDTDATVQANLEKMVSDAQAANVNPILVSPPARLSSIPVGDQSSLHAAAAKAAATAKNCPYIDLTALSSAWYNSLTISASAAQTMYHQGGATHTNLLGADKLAGLLAKAIKDQNIGLAKYLR